MGEEEEGTEEPQEDPALLEALHKRDDPVEVVAVEDEDGEED